MVNRALRSTLLISLLFVPALTVASCGGGGGGSSAAPAAADCAAVVGAQAPSLLSFVPSDLNGVWLMALDGESACTDPSGGGAIDFTLPPRWHVTQTGSSLSVQIEDASQAGVPETWDGTYDAATGIFALAADGNSLSGTFGVSEQSADALFVFNGHGDVSSIFAGTATSCDPGPVLVDFDAWGLRTILFATGEPNLTGTWDLSFEVFAASPGCDVPLESQLTVALASVPDGDPLTSDPMGVTVVAPADFSMAGLQKGIGLALSTPGSTCALGMGAITDGVRMVAIGGREPSSLPGCGIGFVVVGAKR